MRACEDQAWLIKGLTHNGQAIVPARLLLTIAGCESAFGQQREFVRTEKGYMPGGKYYKDAEHVRTLWKRWGVLASSSFGSFQIMFITAYELGFRDHPIELQKDDVGAYWAARLIQRRFVERFRAKTLAEVLDCYNSGYHKDQYIPTLYIDKGIRIYEELESY